MHPQMTHVSHIMVPYRHNAPTFLGTLLIQTTLVPLHLLMQKIGPGYITITSKAINIKHHNDSIGDFQ